MRINRQISTTRGRRRDVYALAASAALFATCLVQLGTALSTPSLPLRLIYAISASALLILTMAALYVHTLRRGQDRLMRRLQAADAMHGAVVQITAADSCRQAARFALMAVRRRCPSASALIAAPAADGTMRAWRLAPDGDEVVAAEPDLSKCRGTAGPGETRDCGAGLPKSEPLPNPLCEMLDGPGQTHLFSMDFPGSSVSGALLVDFPVNAQPDPSDVEWLTSFAASIGLPIDRVRVREELTDLAYSDAMTGLANTRAFKRQLHEECLRVTRYGQPLSLLILDVDHFKRVNDTYGHAGGDCVLRMVADTLRTHVRATDLAARYGGEEFAVLCPSTGSTDAINLAERLRSAVSEEICTLPEGLQAAVTISVGVVTTPREGFGEEALFAMADEALYRAKREGRNRVAVYDGLESFAGKSLTPDGRLI